jgi:putative nucleotidyltransferase with HDIG domain
MSKKEFVYPALIEEIEEKVRLLHFNPPISEVRESRLSAKETFSLFWIYHVKPVINITKELTLKYAADPYTMWLSAILHDIARLYDKEPHDKVGAEMAYDFLRDNKVSAFYAHKVQSTILTHSCKKYPAITLEQRVLATADAMAHFQRPFYLWYCSVSHEPFEKLLEWYLKKIQHDIDVKISFPDEKKQVLEEYKMLMNWCSWVYDPRAVYPKNP